MFYWFANEKSLDITHCKHQMKPMQCNVSYRSIGRYITHELKFTRLFTLLCCCWLELVQTIKHNMYHKNKMNEMFWPKKRIFLSKWFWTHLFFPFNWIFESYNWISQHHLAFVNHIFVANSRPKMIKIPWIYLMVKTSFWYVYLHPLIS